ncbi:MAG: hypothetical protein K8F24_05350 [Bacteroidales bacterium]|nr:hypothetical protein [Bacteroidales bacterium]
MVTGLVDANVIVDLLRGYTPAQTWIGSTQTLGVTRVVWLEVLQGVQDNHKLRGALNILNQFDLVETTISDLEWATQQSIRFTLSHRIDALDYMIAAPSHRLQIPLYTRNLKHMSPILGTLAQEPY